MGQYSLLAVLAAFLLSGVVVYNANQSAERADEKVWQHQYRVIARDAAATGMASAVRSLTASFEANTAWNSALANTLTQNDVAYDGGTYSVTATASPAGPNACPLLNAAQYAAAMTYTPQGDVITVTATGKYEGRVANDSEHRHQLQACYLKADYGQFAPPAFNYGFISEDEFTFNGGPTIQALVEGEGHVHSNGNMTLGPQVEIDGHATYTGTGSVHHNTQVASHGTGPSIPMVPFDPAAFASSNNIPDACSADPSRCLYQSGFTSNGNQTISPPSCDSAHCVDQPFIWYIDGDFTVSGNHHITIPQYTTIVVAGDIEISGGANITVTGVAPPTCNQNQSSCQAAQLAWVQSQLFDGVHSPLAWYGGGSALLNGASGVVGNFYVNGDVTLNGGGTGMNTVGSFASTQGDITANGGGNGNNFWFLEVAEENVIPGVMLPGKQIVRLALAEWTDPVLDN